MDSTGTQLRRFTLLLDDRIEVERRMLAFYKAAPDRLGVPLMRALAVVGLRARQDYNRAAQAASEASHDNSD